MGYIKQIGAGGNLLNPDRDWSRQEGNQIVYTYDGLYDLLSGEMARLRDAAIQPDKMTLRVTEGPMAQLQVYYGSAEDDTGTNEAISVFELNANMLQTGLKRFGYWSESPALTDQQYADVDKALNGQYEGPVFAGKQAQLYALLLKGSDYYDEDQYVLRHTMTVSSRYSTKVAFNRIGHIYSTTNLLAEQVDRGTPIPDEILWSMEGFDTVQPDGPKPTAIPPAYTWGWRKLAPNVTQFSNNRYQITQEWVLYTWETDVLYTAYV